MGKSRLEQLAPLTGLVYAVFVVVAAVVANNYEYLPSSSDLVDYFSGSGVRVEIAGYVGAVAAVFLIWFAGSVRDHLRPAEGGRGRLSAVAFGGGVAGGAVTAAAFGLLSVGGARGRSSGSIGPDAATVLFDGYGALVGIALPITLAAMIGAAAVIGLRTGAWPSWLSWTSAVLAIGSISPVAYIFIAIDLIWILVVAIWLYTKERAQPEMSGGMSMDPSG